MLSPRQPTSPVEAISTPETGSAWFSLENENWEHLIPVYSRAKGSAVTASGLSPSIAFVASSIILIPITLDTNGKLLEALRLHSITFRESPLERNWMLKGPVMFNSRAMAEATLRIRAAVTA